METFQLDRSAKSQPSPSEASCDHLRLITDNLAYIENQCRRAVLRTMTGAAASLDDGTGSFGFDGIAVDNQADELLNEVLDRLKADDFKALREFQGKAKVTTYITTIISNLIIDLVRQKKGRSRARERAREMGELGERLYELVFARGCSLHQAHSDLEITHGICEPLERLQEMLQRMRGRERSLLPAGGEVDSTWLVPGRKIMANDGVEVVVVDPRRNAEARLIAGQQRSKAQRTVGSLLEELSGEDRLMISMRFPADGDDPISAKEIGALLSLSEKCVEARIRRILIRFRQILLKQGLTLDDLIDHS